MCLRNENTVFLLWFVFLRPFFKGKCFRVIRLRTIFVSTFKIKSFGTELIQLHGEEPNVMV